MQWQHGTYTMEADGSLHLTPIAVDGRQLLSDPCTEETGIYTRYNQTELYKVHLTLLYPRRAVVNTSSLSPLAPIHIIKVHGSISTRSMARPCLRCILPIGRRRCCPPNR